MNTPPTPQELAALAENERLQKRLDTIRLIFTPKGFYEYWFARLPDYKTRLDCFHAVNDLHADLLGVPKYSDYSSFKNTHKKLRNEK